MHIGSDTLLLSLQSALIGRYSIERELGAGAGAAVYLARDVRLDRMVALKVLLPRNQPRGGGGERLLEEARTAARLSHPNIVPVLSVEEADEFVFFTMPYVAGGSLAERLASHGPLPPPQGAKLLQEIAWALAYSHAHGVVHRDIKPENVLIENGTGRALVTDFGIATLGSSPATVSGTPAYMSPEQIRGEPPSPGADLYSLSVLAYQALSGCLPFAAATPEGLLVAHLDQAPSHLREVAPGVPDRLAKLVMQGLEKDPVRRPTSAAAYADLLSGWMSSQHRTPQPVQRFQAQWQESRPIALLYFSFAALLLLVNAVYALAEPWRVPEVLLLAALFSAPPVLVLLARVRRLRAGGSDREDLLEALQATAEQARWHHDGIPVRGLAWKRPLLRWLVVTAIGSALAWLIPDGPSRRDLVFLANLLSVGGAVLLADHIGRPRRAWRTSRFWGGAAGRWLFRIASIGVRAGARAPEAPQRTELALETSIRALFERLPEATRRELDDLESVVERLQSDAAGVRGRRREIRQMRTELPPTEAGAKLATVEEGLDRRLAGTVDALEQIRVSLLRLHTGAGSLASITADLGRAGEIAERLARLADAEEEIAEVLQ